MKTITCILASSSLLIAGCFTQSSITGEELAPDDSKVIFYLKDGSYIRSYSDHHHRVDGGYQVSGSIQKSSKNPEQFDGVILDTDLDRIGIDRFNAIGTILVVGGVATIIVTAANHGELWQIMGP